jgi:hypothetical protein
MRRGVVKALVMVRVRYESEHVIDAYDVGQVMMEQGWDAVGNNGYSTGK